MNLDFKELRRGLMVLSNTMDVLEGSREMSLAKTNCQQAMMWTGTLLKYSKQGENPYAKHDGKRETIEHIEPMFDHTSSTLHEGVLDKGLIYTVDQMRVYLGRQIDILSEFLLRSSYSHLNEKEQIQVNSTLFNIFTNLTQTRMWLGMVLGSIRDKQS